MKKKVEDIEVDIISAIIGIAIGAGIILSLATVGGIIFMLILIFTKL